MAGVITNYGESAATGIAIEGLGSPNISSMDTENQETLAQRDDAIFKHGKARGKAETVTAFLNLLDLRCTDIRGLSAEIDDLWNQIQSLKKRISELEEG